MKTFDRKFGDAFLSSCPAGPGVYFFYDASGALIYVGKALNLRKRLGQYRGATRAKKHRKQRRIVKDAVRLEVRSCEDHLQACLLEAELIQTRRPKWNVAGAYCFLYPMIGMKRENGNLLFCYTTLPETFDGFELHGAFRSRDVTGKAFFALMTLLSHLCRSVSKKKIFAKSAGRSTYSHLYCFRLAPEAWMPAWGGFLKGQSVAALETLMLDLLEKPAARQRQAEIQEQLDCLKQFWEQEALALARACANAGEAMYPVPQRSRDQVFLRSRYGAAGVDELY